MSFFIEQTAFYALAALEQPKPDTWPDSASIANNQELNIYSVSMIAAENVKSFFEANLELGDAIALGAGGILAFTFGTVYGQYMNNQMNEWHGY